MNLDLRIPIGSIFTLIGMILTAFGAATHGRKMVYAASLGMNANLYWGPVLLAFGLVMLLLARRGQKQLEKTTTEPVKKRNARRGR
jgi:hypothetical protein